MTGPERDPLAAIRQRVAEWKATPLYEQPYAAYGSGQQRLDDIDWLLVALTDADSRAEAAETRYAALAESITPLPHGAIARRRGCDCSDHLILPDGKVRCGYEGCFLDAPEDDDDCDWEHCPRCWDATT